MDDRTIARGVAWGRVVFGLLMIFAPTRVLSRLAKGAELDGPLLWMCRAFGIRDLVLGAGAVIEMSDPEPDGRWVTAGAVSDTCDIAAAVVWRDELGAAGVASTLALAVPAAALGWKASAAFRP
jgi:hypothetical protein